MCVSTVKCVKNVPAYLAERVYKSMKVSVCVCARPSVVWSGPDCNPLASSPQGLGTCEDTLTRILVSRAELDLLDVRAEYKKLFGCSLFSSLEVRNPDWTHRLFSKIMESNLR